MVLKTEEMMHTIHTREVVIPTGDLQIQGTLELPGRPRGIIIFAHGSGSSRHSPRNRMVARHLVAHGFATLLIDLLDPGEERSPSCVFDVSLLSDRLSAAVDWALKSPETSGLPIGLFGASTGAAAAVKLSADRPRDVQAVVSRGGRPDLASDSLAKVSIPTLLIVGEEDTDVLYLNRQALRQLAGAARIAIVPRATHLFEEPGALEEVASLAVSWFRSHLSPIEPQEKLSSRNLMHDSNKDVPPTFGYIDRVDAGNQLVDRLRERHLIRPVVMGIPRGGVITADVVARALNADLDVAIVRKLGAPGNPECAIGGLAEDGQVWLVDGVASAMSEWSDYVGQEVDRQRLAVEQRRDSIRRVLPRCPIEGRTVVIVDDGIATGSTIRAALELVKKQRPHEIIVAAPVGSAEAVAMLRSVCRDVICPLVPEGFRAVGQFYDHFPPVDDTEMLNILAAHVPT
jgi:predicted phosphoribosyltransferase/dienelactone hydrolase